MRSGPLLSIAWGLSSRFNTTTGRQDYASYSGGLDALHWAVDLCPGTTGFFKNRL